MAHVKGHCDPRFESLRTFLGQNVASEDELGACICVNIDGENAVDIWAGYTDEERNKPWEQDTIVNFFSISKTVTNLAVLMAHDRGLLDVHEKVSKYWPEFAENGKEDVLIKHILSHSSGVAGWEQPITLSEVCDVQASTAKLAKQAPWWKPGTASGYHSLNQGHLGGELIRRVTGKSLKQFIAEEIAGPLGADLQLGAAEEDWTRISTLIAPPSLLTGRELDKDSIAVKALTGPAGDVPFSLGPEWRGAEVGAANGHGNARAVARVLSTISLGGEVDGVRLLSPKTIDLIFEEQTSGMDLVLGKPIRFGIGYGLPNETVPWLREDGRTCFWGGWVGYAGDVCYLLKVS